MKQWPVSVNSHFAKVTDNDILQMQDIIIPNDTKKDKKIGMKVFRDNVLKHNLLTYPVSSLLITKLCCCLSP